ncbi:ATP-binding cassette domain-containing protein, partial [Georgenia yuyongxinii]
RLLGTTAAAAPLAPGAPTPAGQPLLRARGLHVHHGAVHAVRGADLDLHRGEVVALMGRNGSGKSSLLWALQGQGPRSGGTVRLTTAELGPRGADPAAMHPGEARRHVALVPQTPADLLYLPTVDGECVTADAQADAAPGTTRALLDGVAPGLPGSRHPRDLSEGQRLALALAVQLAGRPDVILLDEPTRGLDYAAKAALTRTLTALADSGCAVLLSTHDVEFVAGCAARVLLLADGEVVVDAPAAEVLPGSPTFSPQVAKILHPVPVLTVDGVRGLLVEARG